MTPATIARALDGSPMRRRAKMCRTCPFRGADDAYKAECAEIAPEDWPCHSEGYFGADTDIQCRGHYEARRKFRAELQKETSHDA